MLLLESHLYHSASRRGAFGRNASSFTSAPKKKPENESFTNEFCAKRSKRRRKKISDENQLDIKRAK